MQEGEHIMEKMKKNLWNLSVVVVVVGMLALTGAAQAADYDIVILNGRVMDPETKFDAVRNVGIKNGKIATITEEMIEGKESIDATGHVVAPGFIDTHTHSSDKFSIKMSMMDGVTTGLDLELGALNIAAWYEREKGTWPMNYGQAVSHEMARMVVHDGLVLNDPVDATQVFKLRAESVEDGVEGWSVTVSNLEQMNQLTKILDENLRQGALGIGSTVG
jgi:N-acyl-D-glutamate deacylase